MNGLTKTKENNSTPSSDIIKSNLESSFSYKNGETAPGALTGTIELPIDDSNKEVNWHEGGIFSKITPSSGNKYTVDYQIGAGATKEAQERMVKDWEKFNLASRTEACGQTNTTLDPNADQTALARIANGYKILNQSNFDKPGNYSFDLKVLNETMSAGCARGSGFNPLAIIIPAIIVLAMAFALAGLVAVVLIANKMKFFSSKETIGETIKLLGDDKQSEITTSTIEINLDDDKESEDNSKLTKGSGA